MRIPIYLAICLFIFTQCKKETTPIEVVSETNLYIHYLPSINSKIGFIFYPGALIEANSYAEWNKSLSQKGVHVFAVKFPQNLAILNVQAAVQIINKNPDIEKWFIGGHSLGGAMALQLLSTTANFNLFSGIVLFGAYPGTNLDFSDKNLYSLSLYSSNDSISTVQEITEGKIRMPNTIDITSTQEFNNETANSFYHLISGGNHSNFGDYGFQKGDGESTISKETQQNIMVDYTFAFIQTH